MAPPTTAYTTVLFRPHHASAVARLDRAWVAEETAPWRESALTARAVAELAARPDVAFVVLLLLGVVGEKRGDSRSSSTEVVGYAWADFRPDERDVWLDTRPHRRLAELHNLYCAATHRGRGGGAQLWVAIEQAGEYEANEVVVFYPP
jgi:hypothetical protein